MTDFLQLCFAGLALGSRYALVALGFVIIFKATGVINFAQGAMVTLGAYLAFNFHQTWGLPFAARDGDGRPRRRAGRRPHPAAAAAPHDRQARVRRDHDHDRPALRPRRRSSPTIWGYDALDLGDPWGIDTVTQAAWCSPSRTCGRSASPLSSSLAFFVFFKFSSMGVAMRAAAFDQEAALARGISVRRVFAWSWGIAGGVAALAGVSLGSGPASVTPSLGLIALAAFPAMILGGLDSPLGAVIGGIVIGVTQTLTAGYQPEYAAFLGNNFYVGHAVRRDGRDPADPAVWVVRHQGGASVVTLTTPRSDVGEPCDGAPTTATTSICSLPVRPGWPWPS